MRTYEVEMPDGTIIEGVPEGATREEVLARYRQSSRDAQTQRQQAKDKEQFMQDERDRPWLQRAAINLGAGIDTTWQGAKQLASKVGIGDGVNDEELKDSRRIKDQAAQNMTGGG